MFTSGFTWYNGSKEFQAGLLKICTNGVLTLNEKLLAKKEDLEKLNAGSTTLNNGIDRLSDGISQINSGLAAKKDDLNRLTAGGLLGDGVAKLSESTPKLVDGADKLNTGLNALNANLPSDSDLAAKKSNLNSTLDKLKGLKLTYRTHFNPLNSAFAELGSQLESIKLL